MLYRTRAGRHEVLMGRRPAAARFMPGVYVFPGGVVEPGDRHVNPATPLATHVTEHLRVGGSRARARAMAVTAVRETFEETGLMLAAPGDPGGANDPQWRHWQERGLAPDLECLEFTARAITPVRHPIRFHARFFLADARFVRGELGGDGELEDLTWAALSEADDLPLADVQRFLLAHLNEVLRRESHPRRRPLFTHRRGRRHVRYL